MEFKALSIHIHFGGVLLVLAAPLTSVSLSKNKFFDRLNIPEGDVILSKRSAPKDLFAKVAYIKYREV